MRVHPSLALFVAPVFAIIGAWALMRIGEELLDRTAGAIAFVCWLSFAPLWVNASFVFVSDLPALSFLLLSMLMFVRYWRQPSALGAALLAGFFCASVLFRYPNVLLAPALIIALFAGRKIRPAHAAAAVLPGVAFAATVMLFNAAVYGDALTTGFHLGAELMAETVNYSHESFFKQRPDVLLDYAKTYGREWPIAVPVGLSVAATIGAAISQRGERRAVAILATVTLAILVAYYGQQDAWGYTSAQASASVLRYLLPGFALCMLFAAWAMSRVIDRWGRGLFVLPVVLVLAGALYAHNGPGGAGEVHDVVERSATLKREVLSATEPDAIIAVRIMDKVLFPERQTLTLTYAIQNDKPFPKGERETWGHVPSPERLAEVMSTIHGAGIPVYVLPDAMMGDLAPYQDALTARGLYYRLVDGVNVNMLYQVVPLEVSAR
jgi:4-amino-4-deoxy-L-arabinose transferase-like glycosyltransferase